MKGGGFPTACLLLRVYANVKQNFTSLMASGITDSSLSYHLQNAKAHGVSKEEIAAIITHATMYVGWSKGWAVFRLVKEVWNEEDSLQ